MALQYTTEELDEHIQMFKYYWDRYGDISKYVYYENAKRAITEKHPELMQTWHDYVANEKKLTDLFNKI